MPGVKFVRLKQCCSCGVNSLASKQSCDGCGLLFLEEANDREIRDANKRYEEANRKENKDEEAY